MSDGDVAFARLEDQIGWYDAKAGSMQQRYKWLKILQLVAAALVPVLAAGDVNNVVIAAVGALVVVLEGLQQLYQFQQNWLNYRSTAEALKHEKFLFLSGAGPYADAARPSALLAEKVEGLVSQEHARWTASREEAAKKPDTAN